MSYAEVYWSMYGHDSVWLVASLGMLLCGLAAGYSLGKEHRQPRDERGRFVK